MKYIFTVFCIVISLSCKKENSTLFKIEKFVFQTNSNCPTFYSSSTYQLISDSNHSLVYPCFNPNNSNELLLYDNHKQEIVIFNRFNNSKKNVQKTNIHFPPKWGKKGWITFSNGSIFIVKENGDSLTKINSGYDSEWNIDGSKISYSTFNSITNRNIGVICDIYTMKKDTLPFMLNAGNCWQNKLNRMVYYSSEEHIQQYVIIDINQLIRYPIYKIIDQNFTPSPPCWINENEFVYYFNHTLNLFNITNGINKKIAEMCANDFLNFLSYSYQSKELVTHIYQQKNIGNNKILVSTKIMILNFNDNSVSYINP